MNEPALSPLSSLIPGDSVDPTPPVTEESPSTHGLGARIRTAVIWRSGSQIAGQVVAWASTFLVIRILSPADYGLYAMTQVLLMLERLFNHIKSHEGVRFVTMNEMADDFDRRFPRG